ncbi:MAG: NADPH-dependent F420 reductase [Dehalococcoidia bacterium]|nr:NADPH-dependent F420 reductase [Dehalococcoidia bacterium]
MISIIGGTGLEGRGLAMRLVIAGNQVILGSRSKDRAEMVAKEIRHICPASKIEGASNLEAARKGRVVFIAVPFGSQMDILEALKIYLADKLVVTVVVPLKFQAGRAIYADVPEGSAAAQAQKILTTSRVVAAFQNLSSHDLINHANEIEGDVVVCSDDSNARSLIMEMVGTIPSLRGIDGGGLENARYVEQLTVLLLNINKNYKTNAGIKLIGIQS